MTKQGRVRTGLLAAAFVAVVGWQSGPVAAQGLISELKLGALYHDPGDLWSGFRREPASLDVNAEVIFAPHLAILGGALRPALGASFNTQGGTSKAYLDARWEFETASRIFFAIGLGAAIHDGETRAIDPTRKALGSRVLFHIPAEIGWRWDGHNSISIYFEHISNGYTQDANEGLDSVGVRYGYKF